MVFPLNVNSLLCRGTTFSCLASSWINDETTPVLYPAEAKPKPEQLRGLAPSIFSPAGPGTQPSMGLQRTPLLTCPTRRFPGRMLRGFDLRHLRCPVGKKGTGQQSYYPKGPDCFWALQISCRSGALEGSEFSIGGSGGLYWRGHDPYRALG